jgi:hypothetical protein
MDTFGEAVEQGYSDTDRLAFRFGSDAPLTAAHREAMAAAIDAGQAILIASTENGLKETWETLRDKGVQFEGGRRRFVEAAHALVATRLEPPVP